VKSATISCLRYIWYKRNFCISLYFLLQANSSIPTVAINIKIKKIYIEMCVNNFCSFRHQFVKCSDVQMLLILSVNMMNTRSQDLSLHTCTVNQLMLHLCSPEQMYQLCSIQQVKLFLIFTARFWLSSPPQHHGLDDSVTVASNIVTSSSNFFLVSLRLIYHKPEEECASVLPFADVFSIYFYVL
jgi:hypothetical protein